MSTPIELSDAKVLVIEGNISSFVLLARLLDTIGVKQCLWKSSGWQVMEFIDNMTGVNLILMDIFLPYEDGIEAMWRLRDELRFKDTLIVCVTNDDGTILKRAKAAGFDGFIAKPIDANRFPDQIKRILAGEPVWEV